MTAINTNLLPAIASEIESFSFQTRATARLAEKLFTPQTVKGEFGDYQFPDGFYGHLLRGGTGVGKTYILAALIRQLLEANKLPTIEGSINPFKVIWIMPANAKIQIQRALNAYGLTKFVHIVSYRELCMRDQLYIKWSSRNVGQDIVLEPYWNPQMLVPLVIFDECQYLRNSGTQQTNVALALPTHTMGVKVILASATPFQRLIETRVFTVLCGVITKSNSLPLTSQNFTSVISDLTARNRTIDDYSPKNINNLKEACAEWITEVSGVKFKHKAHTELLEIPFRTTGQKRIYEAAYEAYKDRLRKLEEEKGYFDTGCIIEQWVALGKFMQKAELLICQDLAERAIAKHQAGKQVIVGSEFVATLRGVWTILTKKLGVHKDKIGFIVGGQTPIARQLQVDKWQRGNLDFMLMMKKAGGVAISLHHDRPPSRPRAVILGPTFEAVNLVQFLGRGHRLTSLSDTEQDVLWLAPTVMSERVLPKVATKLTSIHAAVTAREQWGTMLMKFADAESQEEASELLASEQEKSGGSEDEETTGETGEGLSNE